MFTPCRSTARPEPFVGCLRRSSWHAWLDGFLSPRRHEEQPTAEDTKRSWCAWLFRPSSCLRGEKRVTNPAPHGFRGFKATGTRLSPAIYAFVSRAWKRGSLRSESRSESFLAHSRNQWPSFRAVSKQPIASSGLPSSANAQATL